MENLVTDPNQFLAIMPLLVTKLTSYIKPLFAPDSKFVPFIPYILGVGWMLVLRLAFNQTSIIIYALNGICIALSSSGAYDEWKKITNNK